MNSREEEIIRLLTDATNREILTVLNDTDRDLTVSELTERIISGRDTAIRSPASDEDIEQLTISLHHDRLPRLDEAGLIEYDRAETIVSDGDYTAVDPEWTTIDVLDELYSRFRTGQGIEENAIGVLEDREDVYNYGRELTETAETELFLIFTSGDVLDEGCLPEARNAIDRGVELYAGTKTQAAREFFQEFLSEVTIWEPQMDWMYEQSQYPQLSRVIFADREKVLVGLWTEQSDGAITEIAILGEGATNPLVVLVRELLGPRMDHLDYQSDDFLHGLPFEP